MAKKFVTRATFGNLNNHIGVALTLLALKSGEQCCVTEMGMNHPGEIEVLTDIADPDAGIVTNVGMAHIEYMGTQEAIAWEKATLPAQVKRSGVVVLNANDKYTPVITRHCQAVVSTAGVNAGDVSASNLRADGTGTTFTLRATDALGCPVTKVYSLTPACPVITVNPPTLTRGTAASPTRKPSPPAAATALTPMR